MGFRVKWRLRMRFCMFMVWSWLMGLPLASFSRGWARGSSFTVVQFGDGVFESFDQQSKAGRLSRGRVSGSG
ncbi:integral membrane metal-binding family protein (DUF2296) [Actinidia rufa]|uniref:Integral membrane metal-binding family protein (DUF2296) n=1 Tax=Actinidia rufa TaxID=165716 RepID=A0A7J0FWB6_9ERIC|nr:integral membrane metal-binding family protein (DUF2296) [Actinidia rufa]